MGGGNLSPRQQMIGMMYLVLLAMLAMNASKSLLNAFVALEDGINATVKSFDQANYGYYNKIDRAAASSPAFEATQKKAYQLKKLADEACALIGDHKVYLWSGGALTAAADTANGGMLPFLDDNGIPLNKDNQDLGASYYMVIDGGQHADELENSIAAFRDQAVAMLETEDKEGTVDIVENYKYLLDTEKRPDPIAPSDPPLRFSQRISEHMPLAAVTANLSLYQSYIRNLEAEVISLLADKMGGEGIVVDKSEGMASFESGYVLKNDSVFGKVYVSAYNSKITPEIYLCQPDTEAFNKAKGGVIKYAPGKEHKMPYLGDKIEQLPVKAGKGQFRVKAEELGVQVLQGIIKQVSPKGTDYIAFKQDYMVAEPSATVAATGMNLFYMGIPNPVKISASGVSPDELKITAKGPFKIKATKASKGEYEVIATGQSRDAKVIVAKKDGTKLGEQEFRIKPLPKPVPSVSRKSEGTISKAELVAAGYVKAEMQNFPFDLVIRVKSYTLTVSINGSLIEQKVKGYKYTPEVESLLKKVRKGGKVWFDNVVATMPDGSSKNIGSISFKIR
jgi:gliding motility-associated protein GldM